MEKNAASCGTQFSFDLYYWPDAFGALSEAQIVYNVLFHGSQIHCLKFEQFRG